MKVVHTIKEVKEIVDSWKKEGKTIGFIPTMGYLHEGHESLIERGVKENDKVVVSVFVNPIQFGPQEDLKSYPRDLEQDCKVCEKVGANLIFNPQPEEMYGPDFSTFVEVEGLTAGLCGKTRPTHFRGVCTVVLKLFNIVAPDRAYFGQKDAQQLVVIKKMTKDLNLAVEIVGCPIIRESDGLAKSSRNTYLSPVERKAALVLNQALQKAKKQLQSGERSAAQIIACMVDHIQKEPLARIDYVEIVRADTLQRVEQIKGNVLIAEAVYIGQTRLIDNLLFESMKMGE